MFQQQLLVLVTIFFLSIVSQIRADTYDGSNPKYREQIIRLSKSAEMRNYLNASYDPCQNFYKFACGNYYHLNEPYAPPFQNNMLQSISKALKRKFAKLLNEDNPTDTGLERKVKDFYKSCMAVTRDSRHYERQLKEIISEFGEMPLLAGANWQENKFDWVKMVAEIYHRYGFRIIMGCNVEVDIANSTVNRLRLGLQDIPLESPTIYTEDVHASMRHYRQVVMAKNLQKYFGINEKLADKTIKEIFDFETGLFAGKDDESDDEEDTTENGDEENNEDDDDNNDDDDDDNEEDDVFQNLTTIDEMHSKYQPQLDIKRLVNISFGGYIPNDEVYDFLEEDAERVGKFLQSASKRIMANYIYYYLLENFMFTIEKDQKATCVTATKEHFAKVMDNMVYHQYTTRQTEQDVNYMWETLKAAFHSVLRSNKLAWMKYETRSYALEKLNAMKMEINSYENDNLTEEFHRLQINDNDYIENLKNIFAFRSLQKREKINETAKPYDDPEVLSFTPVYVVTENAIKVPVAMLQPYYLWSDYYPNALKFSTLGFLMSHELIHGFDAEGRFFDKHGNIRKWWDKESSSYFKNHTECFSDQYHGYTYNGHLLPRLESQSENIADNGGIRLAYEAYLKWYEDTFRTYQQTDMESLPRLNYTNKQLFFISYGQLWCSATHKALRDYTASTDEHVPEEIRVIGVLANFNEFSKEFKCEEGSQMNPKKKCIIY